MEGECPTLNQIMIPNGRFFSFQLLKYNPKERIGKLYIHCLFITLKKLIIWYGGGGIGSNLKQIMKGLSEHSGGIYDKEISVQTEDALFLEFITFNSPI